MLKKLAFFVTISAAALALNTAPNAQEVLFDPNASCSEAMAGDTSRAALWAFGYVGNKFDRMIRSVDQDMVEDFLGDFVPACNANPEASYVAILEQITGGPAASQAGDTQQSSVTESTIADEVLDRMRAPDADLSSILVSLKPAPDDVRAVFGEPMASNLIKMYEALFGQGLANEDFPPPPYDVSATFTTSFGLVNDPMLREIAGGFKDVLEKFLIDVPFGSVDIVFPSVDDNMRLDGLMFVNDRWVLMMRPWRGL